MELDMVQVLKFGQTEQSMKVSGVLTKQTARENSGMQMETFMKDFGKMTKQMATASMFM
jgi:hypothetical protein